MDHIDRNATLAPDTCRATVVNEGASPATPRPWSWIGRLVFAGKADGETDGFFQRVDGRNAVR
jgi:hypothetical protein